MRIFKDDAEALAAGCVVTEGGGTPVRFYLDPKGVGTDYARGPTDLERLQHAALEALEAALRKDSRDKSITGDTVEYHLDGQAMFHAINKARAALKAFRGDTIDSTTT